jgi:hypothetical protein
MVQENLSMKKKKKGKKAAPPPLPPKAKQTSSRNVTIALSASTKDEDKSKKGEKKEDKSKKKEDKSKKISKSMKNAKAEEKSRDAGKKDTKLVVAKTEGEDKDVDRMAKILARQWYWRGLAIGSVILGAGCLFLSMNLKDKTRYRRRFSR